SIPEQWQVDDYLPEYQTNYKLDVENPMLIGAYALPDDYMEFKYDQQLAMDVAMTKLEEESKEFEKKFNRRFDLIEEYKLESDVAIVSMGSVCGTIKDAIDNFSADVGLLRLIAYRPFPKDKIRDALRDVETVIVIDRAFSYGFEGILFSEIKSAFYNVEEKPRIFGYVAGLGGRDIRIEDIHRIIEDAKQAEKEGDWIGLRGVYT
ncbi:pyruvate ferredoxin oxidoreductase, partial [Archaeoglobales archaeon]